MTKLIRPKKAAEKLGISVPTLYRRIKEPDFPSRIYIGGAVGFREGDLENYMNANQETKEEARELQT